MSTCGRTMPGNTVVNGNKDHDSALRTHEGFRSIKQLGKLLSDTQLSGLAGFHWRQSILIQYRECQKVTTRLVSALTFSLFGVRSCPLEVSLPIRSRPPGSLRSFPGHFTCLRGRKSVFTSVAKTTKLSCGLGLVPPIVF